MIPDNHALSQERAKHYIAAKRLREDVQHLKARWLRYNFPVQELLRLVLIKHGLEAAILATDALDRQFIGTTTAVITNSQPSVITTHSSPSKKGIVRHERCVKASLY